MDDSFDTRSLRPQVPALGELLGNWRLEALLGYGGMGVVYRAVDQFTGVPAAVKVLMEGACSQTEGLKRFRREVQSLARIQSRGVVRVLEEALDHEPPYFCMELLTGGSLAARIEAEHAAGKAGLPADSLLALAQELCDGLAAVHDERVLHRDLKPGNILFSDDGQAKLADFGMAKQLDMTGLTAANQVMGTLPYMAPESLRGEEADRRTDLYQLGITLFEAASGRKPYSGDVLMPLAAGHPLPPLPRLSVLRPELPRVLETFLDGLSAGDREQRFPSAREALQFLADSRALGGADPGLPSAQRSRPSGRVRPTREGSSGELSAAGRLPASPTGQRRSPSVSGPARPRSPSGRPSVPTPEPARPPVRLAAGALLLLVVLASVGWGVSALVRRAPAGAASLATGDASGTAGQLDLSSAVGRAVDRAASAEPLPELARLLAAENRAGAAVERLASGEEAATTQFCAEVFVLDPESCQRPRLSIRPVGEKAPAIDGHVRVSLETGGEGPAAELPLVGETLATGLAEWSVPVPARMLAEGWNRYRIELPVKQARMSLSVTLEFSRPERFPGPSPDWRKARQDGDCPTASRIESVWVVYRDSRLLGAVKLMRELVRQHPFCSDAWFQYLRILLGTLHIREQFGKGAAISIASSFWEDELVRTPVASLRREVREGFNRANRVKPGWTELWNLIGDWSRSIGAHDVALRMARWTVLNAPRDAEAWLNLARAEDRMLPEVKFGPLPQRDRPRAQVVLAHIGKALVLTPADSPLLTRVQTLRAKLLVDIGLDRQAREAYGQLQLADPAEARRGLLRLGAATTQGAPAAP